MSIAGEFLRIDYDFKKYENSLLLHWPGIYQGGVFMKVSSDYAYIIIKCFFKKKDFSKHRLSIVSSESLAYILFCENISGKTPQNCLF